MSLRTVNLRVEVERETDGRWIAEASQVCGCLVYGKTRNDALVKVKACASRALADGYADWKIRKKRDFLHRLLARFGKRGTVLLFQDGEEIGPRMLARIAKRTGLKPEDL